MSLKRVDHERRNEVFFSRRLKEQNQGYVRHMHDPRNHSCKRLHWRIHDSFRVTTLIKKKRYQKLSKAPYNVYITIAKSDLESNQLWKFWELILFKGYRFLLIKGPPVMQQYHQKKKNKKEGKHNCYIILPSSWLRLIAIYHKVLPCNLLPNVYFQLKSITQN